MQQKPSKQQLKYKTFKNIPSIFNLFIIEYRLLFGSCFQFNDIVFIFISLAASYPWIPFNWHATVYFIYSHVYVYQRNDGVWNILYIRKIYKSTCMHAHACIHLYVYAWFDVHVFCYAIQYLLVVDLLLLFFLLKYNHI